MIDRETNGAALDAIITGAEVLAAQKFSVEGRAGIALFRAGRKILAAGRSVRGKGVSQGRSGVWQHWCCAFGGVRTRDETPRGKIISEGSDFLRRAAFFVPRTY